MGYLWKRDPHNVGGWKRRWFTLKGKSLVSYRRVSVMGGGGGGVGTKPGGVREREGGREKSRY